MGDDKIFIHDRAVRPGIVSIGSIAMAEVSIDVQVASNCWHGNSQSNGGVEAQILLCLLCFYFVFCRYCLRGNIITSLQ